MRKYADLLFESMIRQDQSLLPLADRYKATENCVPGALHMFTAWRLTTAVNSVGIYVEDEDLGTVVAVANLQLGGVATAAWARLQVVEEKITEVELYHTKSRGEGGYVLYAEEIGAGWPEAWTRPLPATGRATREELLHLGRAVFDTSLEGPASSPDCTLMENGGVVHEYVDFLDLMMGTDSGPHEPEAMTTMTGVGLDPFRPHDSRARVVAADVEKGVVVTIGLVNGYIMPTVTRSANLSAFVPESMVDMHAKSLLPEWLAGRSVVTNLPVTGISTQIWRMYDSQVQGVQMYNSLTGAGAVPVWLD